MPFAAVPAMSIHACLRMCRVTALMKPSWSSTSSTLMVLNIFFPP